MRLFNPPAAFLSLLAIAQHIPSTTAKPYPVHDAELSQLHDSPLVARQQECPVAQRCGYYSQICCNVGESCSTNADNQAVCVAGGSGGEWKVFTTTYVETVGLLTRTSVYSSYFGGGAAATATTCPGGGVSCNGICCPGGYYCGLDPKVCILLGGGSSGGILPTVPVVTYTGRPTATVPFQTPIPTGVNGAPVPVDEQGGGGLSGGAIAGIVIGVILGILLLLLLCLFCCARALFDTILAIFGLGKKKKHTHEETYIEEHHHSGGGGAAAGGRWYGQGRPSRPSRVGSEKKSGLGKVAGVGAALGGLALMLGLKRKHDKRHDDKSTTVSGSSYYSSYYTSSSSASSSDRRTRNTRHSSRR